MVAVSGARYKRSSTDTMAAYKRIPLLHVDDLHSVIPFDCVPVAVDLIADAKPLERYQHPPRAFYIFGPEDGTLGAPTLSWCRDVVSIPAGCLNLSAAVNIVLYDRAAKMLRGDAT
jgi:tRNA(Leu) C34 or U34 (ribose-2'-O)-methylase TrmL